MSAEHPDFVTITSGMRGYFAVLLCWNPEAGGFYEPENRGIGSYGTAREAEPEARSWAEAEGVAFCPAGSGPPPKLAKPGRCAPAAMRVYYCRGCAGGRMIVPSPCAFCGGVGLVSSDGGSLLALRACSPI